MKLATSSGLGQQVQEVGTRVVYFPQGHSEQVATSTNKEIDGSIPNYPNASRIDLRQLHNVTMHVLVQHPANLYADNGTAMVLAEKGQFDVSKDIFMQVQEAASGSIFVQMPDVWINLAH
ncbi:hypothetical protein IFM89_025235, partial [Coptis chinensis]